jgi:uncharacterized protein with GYD domain
MPKYLAQFSYTAKGLEGLSKEGGSGRRKAVQQLAESFGGRLEAYYYAFGKYDGLAVMNMPDHAAMAAAVAMVNRGGAAAVQTTVLLTPEDVDEAMRRSGTYRPGSRVHQKEASKIEREVC